MKRCYVVGKAMGRQSTRRPRARCRPGWTGGPPGRVASILSVWIVPSSASADAPRPPGGAPSPEQAAMAEKLFDEARQLMLGHTYDEACAKFAESERLDPAAGTLLNLAVCHEAQGRTATASA